METFPDELNRSLNLSQWILKFDKHLLAHPEYYKNVKEYFYESYKENYKLRKEFHNKFLPELDSNLGFPSKKGFHLYEYYFMPLNFQNMDLSKNYYDTDININNNNNNINNITEEKVKKRDSKNEYENSLFKDKVKKMNSAKNKSFNIFNKKNKDGLPIINFQRKSNKSNNYRLHKKQSQSLNINNDNDYDVDIDYESIRDSISNNLETYGKQIDDTDEHSTSKILEQSSMSMNKYKDIIVETNDDLNDNNQNDNNDKKTKIKKSYISKRFKHLGNNNNNNNQEDNNNNNQEEETTKNNNENNNEVPYHKRTKSSYEIFKRFAKKNKKV
jgi:hypothetical protein